MSETPEETTEDSEEPLTAGLGTSTPGTGPMTAALASALVVKSIG